MARLFVFEEAWAKKYNLPESNWRQRYSEPKEPYNYFHMRTVMTPEGRITGNTLSWLSYQTSFTISDNPRLARESERSMPMFMVRPKSQSDSMYSAPSAN